MAMEADHEVVVAQLELGHGRDGRVRRLEVTLRVFHARVLLLLLLGALLLRHVLVQVHLAHVLASLLRRLKRRLLLSLDNLVEGLGVDLPGEDLGADVVTLIEAQTHLLLDEEELLVLGQRPVRLNRNLLHDGGSLVDLASLLLDLGERAGQTGLLNLHEDLAGGDGVEGLDEIRLDREVGRPVDVGDGLLDHGADGLLELRAALGEQHDVLVDALPVAGRVQHLHDTDAVPGRRDEVRLLRE